MKEDIENTAVTNNEKDHRFEIKLNDKLAFVPYRFKDNNNMIVLFHTEVPEEFRGKGWATKLVLHALNYAKNNHLKILPSCPFISKYIKEHPEWMQYVKRFTIKVNH